jgi:nitrate reductase delta subunit
MSAKQARPRSAAPLRLTLRALAHLLGYPDAECRAHLGEMRDALHSERVLTFGRLAELDRLVDRLAGLPGLAAEAEYVEVFDRGRRTALHLFEHVHADSRDRGPAMIDLLQTYEAAGLELSGGELPDYLPALLEYASTQPAASARALLREVAHLLQAIFSGLAERQSAYAAVLGALLDLAGETAVPVALADEPALDQAWEEPAAFGGCGNAGAAAPVQTVRVVRRPPSPAAEPR